MPQIPVFDGFVPGSGDQDWTGGAGDIDEAGAADGLVVRGYLGCGGAAGLEVEQAGGFVCAGADDFGAILWGKSVE